GNRGPETSVAAREPMAACATPQNRSAPTLTSQRRRATPARAPRNRTTAAVGAVSATSGTASLRIDRLSGKAQALPNLGQALERVPPHGRADLVHREPGPLVQSGQPLQGPGLQAHGRRRARRVLERRLRGPSPGVL